MLGGTDLGNSSSPILPPAAPPRPLTPGGSSRTAERRFARTAGEALERRPGDPVDGAGRSREAEERREPVLFEAPPAVPPRVSFRELGSDDEGGPLSEVEGIPEAVRALPLVAPLRIPRSSRLLTYGEDGLLRRPDPVAGQRLDRLA